MAMSARVTNTVHGMIAEKRGGSRRLHRHDPLGSVIGLINDSATTTDTYTYWPYGTLQASTGSTQQPWKFIGKYGYYTDSATHTYVRARKYRKDLGRWLTVDMLWPEESAYGYAKSNPVSHADPAGLSTQGKVLSAIVGIGQSGFFRDDSFGCPECYGTMPCESDPCGYALSHGQVENDVNGWVSCCNEKSYICVRPGKDREVEECIRRHEQYHAAQGSCNNKCNDRLRYDEPFDDSDRNECNAFLIEAACLISKATKKCGPKPPYGSRTELQRWLKCAGALALGIDDACGGGQDNCTAAGLSGLWDRICGRWF